MAYEGYIFEAEPTPLPAAPDPLATGAFQMWPVPTE